MDNNDTAVQNVQPPVFDALFPPEPPVPTEEPARKKATKKMVFIVLTAVICLLLLLTAGICTVVGNVSSILSSDVYTLPGDAVASISSVTGCEPPVAFNTSNNTKGFSTAEYRYAYPLKEEVLLQYIDYLQEEEGFVRRDDLAESAQIVKLLKESNKQGNLVGVMITHTDEEFSVVVQSGPGDLATIGK